jgi:hypothetical protein
VGDVPGGAERADGPRGQGDGDDRQHDAEPGGQPQPVHAHLQGPRAVAGTRAARDGGGGGVREEHAQPHDGDQQGRGQREARELGRPEPADDRRVDQDEQRLRDQRPERRHGQTQDLPVDGGRRVSEA